MTPFSIDAIEPGEEPQKLFREVYEGAITAVSYAVILLNQAIRKYGPDKKAGYPDTACFLPVIRWGVLSGSSDGNFYPDRSLTRAQGAKVAAALAGLEATPGAALFTDVPAGHWAAGYIAAAVGRGFLRGYGDGRFGPEDPLTYEQWLTILIRVQPGPGRLP